MRYERGHSLLMVENKLMPRLFIMTARAEPLPQCETCLNATIRACIPNQSLGVTNKVLHCVLNMQYGNLMTV